MGISGPVPAWLLRPVCTNRTARAPPQARRFVPLLMSINPSCADFRLQYLHSHSRALRLNFPPTDTAQTLGFHHHHGHKCHHHLKHGQGSSEDCAGDQCYLAAFFKLTIVKTMVLTTGWEEGKNKISILPLNADVLEHCRRGMDQIKHFWLSLAPLTLSGAAVQFGSPNWWKHASSSSFFPTNQQHFGPTRSQCG